MVATAPATLLLQTATQLEDGTIRNSAAAISDDDGHQLSVGVVLKNQRFGPNTPKVGFSGRRRVVKWALLCLVESRISKYVVSSANAFENQEIYKFLLEAHHTYYLSRRCLFVRLRGTCPSHTLA